MISVGAEEEVGGSDRRYSAEGQSETFVMASYNQDTFRRFVLSENFRGTYGLPVKFNAEVEANDEALLKFDTYRFLR